MKLNLPKYSLGSALALVVAAATLASTSWAAAPKSASSDKERELISILKSSAPEADKAIACKKLAVYGSQEAVPVLAPLLENEQLASWARIALEAIPGPAADNALRSALPRLHGKLLVGTLNSIGVRRDAAAVSPLKKLLKDSDNEVASAAAVALGRIGGSSAASALKSALAKGNAGTRAGVAEGCVRCAEHFMADGKNSAAIALYDAVRKADVPKQKMLDATRGAILARKDKGVPMLVEALRSPDYAMFGMALHVARELPGAQAADALNTELWQSKPERQPALLLALSDRKDGQAATAAVKALKSGSKKLQIVAIAVLERLGNTSTVPELVNVAATGEADLRQAAVTALTRLPGNEVDGDILKRLQQSSGKNRVVLLELVGLRQIPGAVPVIAPLVDDSDAATRSAAIQALGILGTEKDLPKLVSSLEKTSDAKARGDVEGGLLAISSRVGKAAVPQLLPLAKSGDASCRIIALKALASAGGPEALSAVKAAADDSDESVQDEAVRTLSSWPNTWPEDDAVAEPLLALAGSGKKTSYQVLAVRGYLQYLQGDKKLKDEERISKVGQLLPLVKRAEEKRLVISTVRDSHAPGLLPLLLTFTDEESISEDACSAIVTAVAKAPAGVSKEDREKALNAVMEHSKKDGTRRKAEQLLKDLK